MKKILFSLILTILLLDQAVGQNVPQGISYQAVAIKKQSVKLAGENINHIYWSNKKINVKFSIYENYPGVIKYSETHNVNTDDYGVFSLIIGQGNRISGNFKDINWVIGNAHLQIEIDYYGFGEYELIGVEKFWSVPYSFVSNSSNSTTSDSLISDLFSRYNYLKNRDKDTVIGNEGGVSYKSLDSLNKILLDSIKLLRIRIDKDKDTAIGNDGGITIKQLDSITTVINDSISILRKLINRDKDTIIGNEWQNLSLKGDSLFISNGNSIVFSDNDPKNEIQDLILSGDSIGLTKSNTKISLENLKNANSTFENSGDTTSNIILVKSVTFQKQCLNTNSSQFGLNIYQILSFMEFGDSLYYFGTYRTSAYPPFTQGEFIVAKSNSDCGIRLIYKSQNTNHFNGLALGQSNQSAFFMYAENSNSYITEFNTKTYKITTTQLKTPNTNNSSISGFEKNISNLLVWHFYKDTIYLIYNNNIKNSNGIINGPNRLYKFSHKNGDLLFCDSINDYSDFGVGSNSIGSIQFYDSILYKSNPLNKTIQTLNLFTLKKQLIWSNDDFLSTQYYPNINSNFKFFYFPKSQIILIPENSQIGPSLLYSIHSKKYVSDANWYKQNYSNSIFQNTSPFVRIKNKNNNYIEFNTDWNYSSIIINEPIMKYFK